MFLGVPLTGAAVQKGRPRDPAVEDRVFDAAIAVYAEGGWPDFRFATIAKRAGVGKAALYRRWASPGELLKEVLDARWYPLTPVDEGCLAADLLRQGLIWHELLSGPNFGVLLHMQRDNRFLPEARPYLAEYGDTLIEQGKLIVARAIARGELEDRPFAGSVKDLLVGGVINHLYSTQGMPTAEREAERLAYVTHLVEVILFGIRHGPVPDSGADPQMPG